jgi:hypothetical protein
MKNDLPGGQESLVADAMSPVPRIGRVWLAVIALVLASAVAAAIALTVVGRSTRFSGGGSDSATIVASGGAVPAKSAALTSLAVFRGGRRPADALPARLRSVARELSSSTNGGLGVARLSQSRLVISGNAGSLYAWPIGPAGLCVGVESGAARCLRVLSADSPLGPSLLYASPGRRAVVAGLVSDNVKLVLVSAGSAHCTTTILRNGFICDLNRTTVPAHASVRLTLVGGRVQSASLP